MVYPPKLIFSRIFYYSRDIILPRTKGLLSCASRCGTTVASMIKSRYLRKVSILSSIRIVNIECIDILVKYRPPLVRKVKVNRFRYVTEEIHVRLPNRSQWRRQAFQTGGALHSMEDSRGGTRKNKR